MSHINPEWLAYQKLAQAAATFSPTEPALAFSEFIAFARQFFSVAPVTESGVMEWLSAANRQADCVPLAILVKDWIPCVYHARTGEVSWCLPQGRAVQPFYDEYISHCRQYLVNALVAPRSSIKSLLLYAEQLSELPDPSGFIFHLSRCGSTLVSGCLAQLENCSMLSESPLLTEILLAKNIGIEDKKCLLRLCIHLQGRPSLKQPHVIVKWNAWDLFYWDLIHDLYPQVPIMMLTRAPVEILASHQKNAGRHMSGDMSLIDTDPVFDSRGWDDLLAFRAAILHSLMLQMLNLKQASAVMQLDYAQLNVRNLQSISKHFGVEVRELGIEHFSDRFTRNAKQLDQNFVPDTEAKRNTFDDTEVALIIGPLARTYERLIFKVDKQGVFSW
jgi:hypothetical protein